MAAPHLLAAPDLFAALARNNAWSNHRLYRACAGLSEAERRAERSSFFPSIDLTLSHIYLVDLYYLDALHEEGRWQEIYAMPDEPFAGLSKLRAAQQASDAKLIAFCEALSADGPGREVVLFRPGGKRYDETISAVLLHLFQHQIHHRGQVHAMLSSTALAPPQLDEFFLAQDADLRREDFAMLGWPEPAASG